MSLTSLTWALYPYSLRDQELYLSPALGLCSVLKLCWRSYGWGPCYAARFGPVLWLPSLTWLCLIITALPWDLDSSLELATIPRFVPAGILKLCGMELGQWGPCLGGPRFLLAHLPLGNSSAQVASSQIQSRADCSKEDKLDVKFWGGSCAGWGKRFELKTFV